jgi:2-C-methyl-D-erythritol 2,4-cyclodiphosphate synthase
MAYRIGFGTDYHQLENGRKLWLGGVHIPHLKGSVGHSDGDTLLHAICDALLGALNLGDIGLHFPDTDAAYKGIDSKILLDKTFRLVRKKGYILENLDSTICLEKPKIMLYADQMRQIIAGILETGEEAISIKATTTEKMGFVGREEGVAAYAVVLLKKVE